MVGLAVFADRGFFDLDEIAHMHAAGQFSAGTQARERADDAGAVGDHTLDVAVRMHDGTGREFHVLEPGERADAHVVAKYHVAFEDDVDIEFDIVPRADRTAHIDARRVG